MNPILKQLGYSETDRVIIIHADDVGINHASIEAYEELMELGTISTGSVMAHSAWLPEVINRAKDQPEWDLGVHLAFNCEYQSYRWRPLTHQTASSGLIDEQGYFKQNAREVMESAEPDAVKEELEAQIELVRSLGLDVTHIDTHSGTLWHPRLVRLYAEALEKQNVFPVIVNQEFMDQLAEMGMPGGGEEWAALEAKNFPFVDAIAGLPMDKALDVEERFALAKKMLLSLEPGKLTHFAFHPMKDTEEARGLQRYTEARTGDYKVFIKDEMKQFMAENDIQLIGYREIRDALGLKG